MPAFLEKELAKGAAKKGFTGKKAAGYIYGAMNNMGAMRGNKETAKGERMEEKHEADKKKRGRKTKHRPPMGGTGLD